MLIKAQTPKLVPIAPDHALRLHHDWIVVHSMMAFRLVFMHAQGAVPAWPSVLAQLTGFSEASTPAFGAVINQTMRLISKLDIHHGIYGP